MTLRSGSHAGRLNRDVSFWKTKCSMECAFSCSTSSEKHSSLLLIFGNKTYFSTLQICCLLLSAKHVRQREREFQSSKALEAASLISSHSYDHSDCLLLLLLLLDHGRHGDAPPLVGVLVCPCTPRGWGCGGGR